MTPSIRAPRPGAVVAGACALLFVAVAGPAAAQYHQRGGGDHSLRVRAGIFEPDGESQYWTDAADLFTGGPAEFEDFSGGFDYALGLGEGGRLSLLISGSVWEGSDQRHYLDFVDNRGNEIEHDATLGMATFTAGLKVDLAPRSPVRPYVGAGGGLYVWDLEESGEFIFFAPGGNDIFGDTFSDDGATAGWYYMVGLEIPLGPGFSILGEARWHEAEDDLGGDFEDFGKLDLSGREITGGLAWRF